MITFCMRNGNDHSKRKSKQKHRCFCDCDDEQFSPLFDFKCVHTCMYILYLCNNISFAFYPYFTPIPPISNLQSLVGDALSTITFFVPL